MSHFRQFVVICCRPIAGVLTCKQSGTLHGHALWCLVCYQSYAALQVSTNDTDCVIYIS